MFKKIFDIIKKNILYILLMCLLANLIAAFIYFRVRETEFSIYTNSLEIPLWYFSLEFIIFILTGVITARYSNKKFTYKYITDNISAFLIFYIILGTFVVHILGFFISTVTFFFEISFIVISFIFLEKLEAVTLFKQLTSRILIIVLWINVLIESVFYFDEIEIAIIFNVLLLTIILSLNFMWLATTYFEKEE